MSNWISSKLKVAETLLQQIDQQAAESLRKDETKQSDGLVSTSSTRSSGSVPLRDQLKKKTSNANQIKLGNDEVRSVNKIKLGKDVKKPDIDSISAINELNRIKLGKDVKSLDSNSKSTLNDGDWTELLNTPKQPVVTRTSRLDGVLKDGGKGGIMGLKGKSRGKVLGKTMRKEGFGNGGKGNGDVGNGAGGLDDEKSMGSDRKSVKGLVEGVGSSLGSKKVEGNVEMGDGDGPLDSDKLIVADDSPFLESSVSVPVVVSDVGKNVFCDERYGKATSGMNRCDEVIANSVTGGLRSASLFGSDHELDSDSSSTSDSGFEQEREERMHMRRQILAAKAASKALEAIKEQENVVARLEGEKQSLEKILEEQANQAAQEASELQSMTIEMMEAAELEKQKHNHTRMEVLAQLAKSETSNADLAKSLGTAQWNFELEINRQSELRHKVEVKKISIEELKRKIYSVQQTRDNLTSLMASKSLELQKEMLEAECAFATDKTARLQEKVMKLEENIDLTLKEMENSTEIEVELRRRLRQMTDHLIQKQAQVESLSSNKATLLFRIEATSRLLSENKSLTLESDISGSSREDLEAGTWVSSGSKLPSMLEHKFQSGRLHLGSLLKQLDAIFSAGAIFLARNPAAKLWSLVYLVSLHLWVLYIFLSHSHSTEDSTSSSVVSLENINGSIGA